MLTRFVCDLALDGADGWGVTVSNAGGSKIDTFLDRRAGYTSTTGVTGPPGPAGPTTRWPPGPTCDRCLSDEFAWTALSGTATVLSWTTFRRCASWRTSRQA